MSGARRNGGWLAGVDGCPTGWVVAFVRPAGGEARVRVVSHFTGVLAAPDREGAAPTPRARWRDE